jgi:hypothetical protein
MIKNADLPAIPNQVNGGDIFGGLTKREMFAMAAMQGLTSSVSEYSKFHELATDAVSIADALLAELEKKK